MRWTRATVAALHDACAGVAEDETLRALVLVGDAAAWSGWSAAAQDAAESLGLIGDPFGPLAALPQPTVAALAGEVRDAGLELALCADVRVAAGDARLGLPSLLSGVLPHRGRFATIDARGGPVAGGRSGAQR